MLRALPALEVFVLRSIGFLCLIDSYQIISPFFVMLFTVIAKHGAHDQNQYALTAKRKCEELVPEWTST